MADNNILNPSDFVPDSLPKSAIGRGGLSAVALAAHGSPQAPRPQLGGLGGGLVSDDGQAQLEQLLFPRVRTPDQLDQSAEQRRGALSQLQQAITTPQDTSTGLDNIMLGMTTNDHPWDVGYGLRQGVANAIKSKMSKEKTAQEAGVQSAVEGLKFEQGENQNDYKLDNEAVTNLRALAKPIRLGGAGAGSANGFRWVPGTGYVDTLTLDENGNPKVVFKDSKMLVEARQKARSMAEKQAANESQRIPFKSDAEREQFIENRTDQIVFQSMQGAAPAPQLGGADSSKVPPQILDGLKQTESSGDTYAINPQTKAMGPYQFTPETVAQLHKNGYTFNPLVEKDARGAAEYLLNDLLTKNGGDMRKALAAYGGFVKKDPSGYIAKVLKNGGVDPASLGAPAATTDVSGRTLIQPQDQKKMNSLSEGVGKQQSDRLAKFSDEATTGQNLVSTVQELQQLKFNPGMFAKWQQRGGNLLEALGSDGPMAKMAAQSGNAEALLQALSNARISLEKGVQTKDDEIRFKKEIASISDPRAAYDYMLKHMVELGTKAQEKKSFYDNYLQQNGGSSLDGADEAWQNRNNQYGGMVKKYNGNFVGRSEFINAMVNDAANLKAYGGDKAKLKQRAEAEWQRLGSK